MSAYIDSLVHARSGQVKRGGVRCSSVWSMGCRAVTRMQGQQPFHSVPGAERVAAGQDGNRLRRHLPQIVPCFR